MSVTIAAQLSPSANHALGPSDRDRWPVLRGLKDRAELEAARWSSNASTSASLPDKSARLAGNNSNNYPGAPLVRNAMTSTLVCQKSEGHRTEHTSTKVAPTLQLTSHF